MKWRDFSRSNNNGWNHTRSIHCLLYSGGKSLLCLDKSGHTWLCSRIGVCFSIIVSGGCPLSDFSVTTLCDNFRPCTFVVDLHISPYLYSFPYVCGIPQLQKNWMLLLGQGWSCSMFQLPVWVRGSGESSSWVYQSWLNFAGVNTTKLSCEPKLSPGFECYEGGSHVTAKSMSTPLRARKI
jgi:hypothetical protein